MPFHALAGLLLTFAPSQIWLGEPVWQGGADAWGQGVGLAAAYWIGVVLLRSVDRAQSKGALIALSVVTIPLAAFYLAVMVFSPSYSRGVLLVGTALLGLLFALPRLLARPVGAASLILAAGLSVVVAIGFAAGPIGARTAMTPADTLFTHHGRLAAIHLGDLGDTIPGGGLAHVGDDLLLVTGAGEFFRIQLGPGSVAAELLSLRTPMNRDDFVAATDTAVLRRRFRVAGILTQPSGDSVRVLVSHHFWKVDEACFVLRLSETTVAAELGALHENAHAAAAEWRTLFETSPCLGIKDQGDAFAGQQAGGRIAALGDSAVLLSVGDHQFDGVNAETAVAQAVDNDYGKTILIPRQGPTRVFTLGHRNPQGLVVTAAGEIWLAEHGPRGGDELNLLVDGANYGWPLRTLGTQYEELSWPLSDPASPEDGFAAPAFAWVPSIGVSNLIEIETDAVAGWRGDLLVAALLDRSLHRLHRVGGGFVYSERIDVRARVRDLTEVADGRLVLWSDDRQLSVFTPIDER